MSKFFQRMHAKKRGFTLIELIIVIAILGILAAILVPTMLGIVNDSRDNVNQANARSILSIAKSSYVSLAVGSDSVDEATLKTKIENSLESDERDKAITIYCVGTGEAGSAKITKITGVRYGDGTGDKGLAGDSTGTIIITLPKTTT